MNDGYLSTKRGRKSRAELGAEIESLLRSRDNLRATLESRMLAHHRTADQLSGMTLAAQRLAALAVKGRKQTTIDKFIADADELTAYLLKEARNDQ